MLNKLNLLVGVVVVVSVVVVGIDGSGGKDGNVQGKVVAIVCTASKK